MTASCKMCGQPSDAGKPLVEIQRFNERGSMESILPLHHLCIGLYLTLCPDFTKIALISRPVL